MTHWFQIPRLNEPTNHELVKPKIGDSGKAWNLPKSHHKASKQLDSGKGTLMHLCDDVNQQEAREVIICLFILMEQRKDSLEDFDY